MKAFRIFPRLVSFLAGLLLLVTTSSCEFRSLTSHLPPDISAEDGDLLMIIDVDWSDMDTDPTGMTLLFYPSDGSAPYVRLTNSVFHYEYVLPEDNYEVLVFNQSVAEFPYVLFRGLENIEKAEICCIESDDPTSRIDRLYQIPISKTTRARSNSMKLASKGIGSASTRSSASTRARSNSMKLASMPSIGSMRVDVRVSGMSESSTRATGSSANPVVAVNGALTGMAAGYYIGLHKVNGESITEELNDWTIRYATTPDGIGSIHTEFGTFGISSRIDYSKSSRSAGSYAAEADSSPDDDTRNILYLNFRFADNTYAAYRFDVTDRIVERSEKDGQIVVTVILELDLGLQIAGGDPNDPLNDPIVLPESGREYSPYHVSVKDWEEETIDVRLR